MLEIIYFLKFYIIAIVILFIMCSIQFTSLYSDFVAQRPSKTEYDYIIVGAGTAGTTILRGMNSDLSILLIDAGSMPVSLMDIPIITPLLHRTRYDWGYETSAQKGACKSMNGQKSRWAAGKGFGGSNLLNNMVSNWCHKEDFRGLFGNPESYDYYKDILPFFKDTDSQQAVDIQHLTKFGEALLKMGKHKGIQFHRPKLYQKDGWRWTMAHEARKQLNPKHEIITGTLVTKVIFDENRQGEAYATGVRLSKFGKTTDVTARYGIILSAGTIGTPKILMQSGIGLCDEISLWGITCRRNLPVGQNLQDHVSTGLDLITLNTSLGIGTFDLVSVNVINNFVRYGSGPLTVAGCEALGIFEADDKGTSPPELGFMAIPVGITTDLGIVLRNIINLNDKWWNEYFEHIVKEGYQAVTILPILLHPKSVGTIRLGGRDPFDPPIINPRYFEHKEDIELLVKGLELIDELLKVPELSQLGAKIYDRPFPGCEAFIFKSKSYWECYVRHFTLTVYHPVGTCRMGDELDSRTVVNRNYRVKGTENLFVVDASILPSLPSGNPNAVVAMLARRFLEYIEHNTAQNTPESLYKEEL